MKRKPKDSCAECAEKQARLLDNVGEINILIGRIGEQDPAIVEAWMRVEHGTLDALSRDQFRREVSLSLDCAAACTPEQNIEVARSCGFTVKA